VKEVILTAEGYERLKSEIEYLSNEKRREVADRIRIAREFGDIAENSEYDVGSAEANPAEYRLSNESPVGKAIIGHKKGETVEVPTPRGSLKYKILEIKAA